MKLRLLILMLIPFQMVYSQTVPITFIYTNKTASNVYLAGNINSWNMSDAGYKFTDSNGDGTFELTTNLAKGNHQYKFVVDGEWLADPNNPVTDGTEYNNSLITVSDPMVTYLLPKDTIEYKISKAPLITAIVAFGNTTTIGISNLSLKINNVSVPISTGNYNQITKIFTYQSLSSQLVDGVNAFEFKITTTNGSANVNRSFRATEVPAFNLLTEDMIYFNPNIVVYGKLKDLPIDSVKIKINGISKKASVNADSIFYLPVTLVDGINNVEVTLLNLNGSRTKKQTLTYQTNKRPAVDVQASVVGRTVTLSANAISPIGKTLSFVWSQPEASPSGLINGDLTAGGSIQLTIPSIAGEYFIKVKVTDAEGNFNIGGCLIRSTIENVSIVSQNEQPAWIKHLILYEISSYEYYKTTSPAAGIISKLDYIAGLGVNTIWLTPIFEGTGNSYWTKDYYKISSYFGTIDELKELVKKAHSKGLKVLLDLAINASWVEHPFYKNVMNLKTLSPFADYYLWSGTPGASNSLHSANDSLVPYFNSNNTNLNNYLFEVAEYYLRECNIDGYRYDSAWGPEIRNSEFWKEMRIRLKKVNPNIFLLAELPSSNNFNGTPTDIFSNKFDAAYDWDFRSWGTVGIAGVVNGVRSINELNKVVTTSYVNNFYPMRFIGNHDNVRFAVEFGTQKAKLAETIVFTVNGIPLLYGGDEVGEESQYRNTSWADPSNLTPYFQKLIEIRKKYLKNNAKVVPLANTLPTDIYSNVTKSDTNIILTTANFSNQAKTFTINFKSPEITEIACELSDLFSNTSKYFSFNQLQANTFMLNPFEAKVYKLSVAKTQLLNGEFLDNQHYWSNYTNTGSQASFTVENNSLIANIVNGGTKPSDVQYFQQNILIEKGKTYDILFDASATQIRTINIGVNKASGDNPGYFSKIFTLTTSMQHFIYTATMTNETDWLSRFFIELGGQNVNVKMDNIIFREHVEYVLAVSTNSLTIGASDNSTKTFEITSNTNWKIECDLPWLKISSETGSNNISIKLTASANTATTQRTATVTVSSGTPVIQKTIIVTQDGIPNLTVTPSNQNVSIALGTTNFAVVSNIAWAATSNQIWCTITPLGTGNGTITATFLPYSGVNSRTATITVSGAGISNQIVTVTQSGTTGTYANELSRSIKVYPNPVTDELIIEFLSNKEKTEFKIFNSISQVVSSGYMVDRTVVKTINFAPGIYMVKLKSGDIFEFKKFIKK